MPGYQTRHLAPSTPPLTLSMSLPFVSALVPVTLVDARITFEIDASGLMTGQVNGAIRVAELNTVVIPACAAQRQSAVTSAPGSPGAQQILDIFDTGGAPETGCANGCKNSDGTCAMAGDEIISDCEVATNSIIKNVLAPDVQLFDATGTTFAPTATPTMRDSLTVGVGFTGVACTFLPCGGRVLVGDGGRWVWQIETLVGRAGSPGTLARPARDAQCSR